MKLRNKLILSCAALAAVATTAFSTTFAWYTSNVKVTAENISGTSAASGSQLLMIAEGLKETATTTGTGSSEVTTYSYTEMPKAEIKWGTSIANVTETRSELRPLAYVTDAAAATTSADKYTLMNLATSTTFADPDTAVTDQASFETAFATGRLYALASAAATTGTKVESAYVADTTVTSGNFADKKTTLYVKDGNNYVKVDDGVASTTETFDATATYFVTAYDSTKTYKLGTISQANPTDSFADEEGSYIEFRILLKNASTTAANLNINITSFANTTGTLPAQSIIDSAANAKFLGLADTEENYTVDFARALCLDLEIYKSTDGGETNGTLLSENIHRLKDASSVVTFKTDSLVGKTGTASTIASAGATYSAHQYRNNIMTEQIATTDPTSYLTDENTFNAAGKISNLVAKTDFFTSGTAATKNNCLVLVGKIFLNGWDYACFDACQGQTFQMGISFDVTE